MSFRVLVKSVGDCARTNLRTHPFRNTTRPPAKGNNLVDFFSLTVVTVVESTSRLLKVALSSPQSSHSQLSMASTEKTVTLWLYFSFLLAAVVIDVNSHRINRPSTLTFHPSLQVGDKKTREIVMPVNSFDQNLDPSQHLSESDGEPDSPRSKRQAFLPQGSVRGLLPSLPANSTTAVS